MSQLNMDNQASVATPSSGATAIYVDSTTKKLKSKDDTGAITDYSASGSAITSLTGEVTATGPGASAATVGNAAVIGKVLTGLSPVSGTLAATDTILQAFNKLASKLNKAWFPTYTDGTVTIAVDTTLVRDMYYDSLTVNSGVILYTAGFRIFAETLVNNGTIDRSGNNGVVNTAGAALAVGTLGLSGAGGAGGTAAGTAGGAVTGLGGAGGTGGAGSGGAGAAGGSLTVITAANGGQEVLQHPNRATLCRDLANTLISGGAGGGGGGGDGVAGGGGGSGGGVMLIVGRSVTGTGLFRANGGAGGTPAGGNRGGGAGGGGGVIAFVTENDTTMESFTVTVSGGVGSSGTGTGVVGNNGSVGRIYRVRV
jgi:hypothetical protein